MLVTLETITADNVTETAIVSMGTNSPDYDNIYAARAVVPVEGSVETIVLPASQIINSGGIYVRVIRAATATDLTFVFGLGYIAYTN